MKNEKYGSYHLFTYRIRYGCTEDSLKKIEYYLQKGADPNMLSGQPLYFAAKYNCTDVVNLLLEQGANPNQTYRDEKTIPELIRSGAWDKPRKSKSRTFDAKISELIEAAQKKK